MVLEITYLIGVVICFLAFLSGLTSIGFWIYLHFTQEKFGMAGYCVFFMLLVSSACTGYVGYTLFMKIVPSIFALGIF